jgi:hypothetical protein
MAKIKAASKLLKALGKTKKEQMAKVYPKVKGDIRGKGPYLRGTMGKKGADTFIARRAVMAGTKSFPKPTKKKGIGIVDIVGAAAAAGASGYAIGKYGPKKTEARTHIQKAREGAKELIKKQKAKKEKRKSPH